MDRATAIADARYWVKQQAVYIDTETTGFKPDDRVVDVSVVDFDGVVLFDTLINPCKPIDPEASAVTGITDDMVKDAPTFLQVWARLAAVLKDRTVITYNASFDTRLLRQSAEASGIGIGWSDWCEDRVHFACAMLAYADYYGDWNDYRHNNRWQKLSLAAQQCGIAVPADLHRARADAELARLVVLHMANTEDK